MKFAAVDIGTNSCRLLIAEIDAHQRLIPLHRSLTQTRLGQGWHKSGSIGQEAINRSIACLDDYVRIISRCQAACCRAVATSALREAVNRDQVIQIMASHFPWPIDIIEGEQEAWLTYQGVRKGLPLSGHPVVVDPGGGSTEIILGWEEEVYIRSLPLGAVRATESGMSRENMEHILRKGMGDRGILSGHPLVFTGGTATSLVSIKLGQGDYKPELIHGQVLSIDEVRELSARLAVGLEERKKIPGLQPERADILPQGARIIELIMSALEAAEMTVSESDLLEGVIWELYENQVRL